MAEMAAAQAGGLVLRVFTHPACSGCTAAVQAAWRTTDRHGAVSLETVSLVEASGLAAARAGRVTTIPTMILLDRGTELDRWVGTPSGETLDRAVAAAVGNPSRARG